MGKPIKGVVIGRWFVPINKAQRWWEKLRKVGGTTLVLGSLPEPYTFEEYTGDKTKIRVWKSRKEFRT